MTFEHLCGSSSATCLSHLKGPLLLLPAGPYMLFSQGMCLSCRLSGVGGSALFGDGVMSAGQAGGECKPTGTSSGGEVEVRMGDMWTWRSHLCPQSHFVQWAIACRGCMHASHCPSLHSIANSASKSVDSCFWTRHLVSQGWDSPPHRGTFPTCPETGRHTHLPLPCNWQPH